MIPSIELCWGWGELNCPRLTVGRFIGAKNEMKKLFEPKGVGWGGGGEGDSRM